jgi:hypothetical protein
VVVDGGLKPGKVQGFHRRPDLILVVEWVDPQLVEVPVDEAEHLHQSHVRRERKVPRHVFREPGQTSVRLLVDDHPELDGHVVAPEVMEAGDRLPERVPSWPCLKH